MCLLSDEPQFREDKQEGWQFDANSWSHAKDIETRAWCVIPMLDCTLCTGNGEAWFAWAGQCVVEDSRVVKWIADGPARPWLPVLAVAKCARKWHRLPFAAKRTRRRKRAPSSRRRARFQAVEHSHRCWPREPIASKSGYCKSVSDEPLAVRINDRRNRGSRNLECDRRWKRNGFRFCN